VRTPLDRNHFPVTERWAYFDHAGIAPLSTPVVEAVAAQARAVATDGSVGAEGRLGRLEEVRERAARLLGAPVTDVAFVKNTTEGMGFVASGLDFGPGDRVVVPDLEFPSTLLPWVALEPRGVQVDRIAPVGAGRTVPLERLAEAVEAGPCRVVASSWVQFGRGWRSDLAELAAVCHEHGALLCVDLIQGLGVVPASLAEWGVDFAAADAHKWLLGPEGIGVFYVAERCRDLLRPLEPGWASVAHRTEWENLDLVWAPDARRFEGGSFNMLGVTGLGAAIDLLLDAGVDRIWQHVDGLLRRAAEGLAEAGATVLSDRSGDGRSGILTFEVPGVDAAAACRLLEAEGVVASARAGGVRVSPHGYTTEAEVDTLVAAVESLR
jgi:cysteine desulfurase / selenocysteine lyase